MLERLFPELHGFGVKWGLEKTRRLLRAAGDPLSTYQVIHIGGTNGKGSVSAMIASVLRAAGHRVGLYTSPHLTRFNERFQVDGRPLADDVLVAAADRLRAAVTRVEPTFFEATTAVGLTAFAEAAVDVAVVEVGLGGRLDATNVVRPLVSVLTNVGMDHMQFLGTELTGIAAEKAGIAKRGVPLVTAVSQPELRAIVRERARAQGAPLVEVTASELGAVILEPERTSTEVRLEGQSAPVRLSVPLAGPHQALNLLLATRALERLPDPFRPNTDVLQAGLASAHWPGRLQRIERAGCTWLFDVAHNVPGVESMIRGIRALEMEPPLLGLVGILSDKQWGEMTLALANHLDALILTDPPSAPRARSWDPHAAARRLRAKGFAGRVHVVSRFGRAVARAIAERPGTIVVTGSCHTVGDAFLELGIEPFPGPDARPAAEPAAVDFR